MKIYKTTLHYVSGTTTSTFSDSPRAWQHVAPAYDDANPLIFEKLTLSSIEVDEEQFQLLQEKEIG